MKIIRWLLFIPVSILGGFLVFIVFDLFSGRFIEPGSVGSLINNVLGGGLSGAAAMYVAAYIAPCYEEKVALGYALLALVAIVFTVPLLANDSISYILFYIAQNIGIFYMAWLIYRREITFVEV